MVELKRRNTATVATTNTYSASLFNEYLLDLSSSSSHRLRTTLETSVSTSRPALEVGQTMLGALTLHDIHSRISRFRL